MREIKPPHALPIDDTITVFLAGSIEMGMAEKWQDAVVRALEGTNVVICNPRREQWDISWKQNKDNPDFREQVEWELNALAKSDYIIMYFDPKTKSSISLLEMGLYARSGKLFVVCPDDFWKKGNVDIVCEKYNVRQFSTLDALLDHFIALFDKK